MPDTRVHNDCDGGACAACYDDQRQAARDDAIDALMDAVRNELIRAEHKHAPMNSPHEGWSVIFEELEELREHVRADTGRGHDARKEAIQTAAMGLRYALNLCAPLGRPVP